VGRAKNWPPHRWSVEPCT